MTAAPHSYASRRFVKRRTGTPHTRQSRIPASDWRLQISQKCFNDSAGIDHKHLLL